MHSVWIEIAYPAVPFELLFPSVPCSSVCFPPYKFQVHEENHFRQTGCPRLPFPRQNKVWKCHGLPSNPYRVSPRLPHAHHLQDP